MGIISLELRRVNPDLNIFFNIDFDGYYIFRAEEG